MTVGIDDDAVINNIIMTDQGSNPATPSAGKSRIFTKSDGLYFINDDAASSLVTLWSNIQASQLVNEIKGWPPIINTGSLSALNLWWDNVGTVSVGAAVVPTASESITENYELAIKVVASSGSSGVYQRYTYAEEPRIKSGRILSALVAIWSVSSASVTARLVNSDDSETVASAVTAAAWTIVEIPSHSLAGTYCDLQITVAAPGTFYVVPLGVNIGTRAYPLPPRPERFVDVGVNVVNNVDPGGTTNWTDVDITTQTSPLAFAALLVGVYVNSVTNRRLDFRRNGDSTIDFSVVGICYSQVTNIATIGHKKVFLDDAQIFEYLTTGQAADTESVYVGIGGYWEWA